MMKYLMLILFSLAFLNCTNDSIANTIIPELPDEFSSGSGVFEYDGYAPFGDKIIKVYYHIPENTDATTPILFVFHGASRNASDYRGAMVSKSNQHKFIVIAPQFSSSNFPGGDSYNLGNVFEDGDNPSASTLNPEDQWTFSVIEPLFDYFKDLIRNESQSYSVFGHSAGGQFAHRYLMYKPNSRLNTMVASASGWYTTTDLQVSFPYGFKKSPLETSSLSQLFEKNLIVLIGSLDNDPNAPSLRRNSLADAQGTNRYTRARYFFQEASQLSNINQLNFNWALAINEGADHNFRVACSKGADLIFN